MAIQYCRREARKRGDKNIFVHTLQDDCAVGPQKAGRNNQSALESFQPVGSIQFRPVGCRKHSPRIGTGKTFPVLLHLGLGGTF